MSAALRARVAKGLSRIITKGQSLTEVLPDFDHLEAKDKALARELTFGTLRQYVQLKAISDQLLQKPLKNKDGDVLCLILLGLYQLFYTRIPDHAVLSETVQAALKIKKQWAKGLINALLRKALRESEHLLLNAKKDPATEALLPEWIYRQIATDWPENLQTICQNSHQRAPLTLRVNSRHGSRESYQQRLEEAGIASTPHPIAQQALVLDKSCDVQSLPGYQQGDFSVQDGAAQMAAELLDVKPDQLILDACAAPGGKTAHILEKVDNRARVLALDSSEQRLKRLDENLQRLDLNAQSIVADARDTNSWYQGEPFDRILCDAPCSALGIIRRHPDIAILRRQSDIETLNATQAELLEALWPLLKPGGILLYSTCSILKSENEEQIAPFLKRHRDAEHIAINPNKDTDAPDHQDYGWQILPGEQQMDGFYYAKLRKKAVNCGEN